MQINGAQISNKVSGGTFSGDVLSNFVLHPAIANYHAGSVVAGVVIGELFIMILKVSIQVLISGDHKSSNM